MVQRGDIQERMEPAIRMRCVGSPEIEKYQEDDTEPPATKYNREGILGFFSGIERTAADEIECLAANISFTEEEEAVVRRKLDLRILPIVLISWIFDQLDRINIGNAHVLSGFNKKYGIETNQQWTLLLSVFYIGYCLLEIPSNILQRHIGANRFFFLSLSWWGLSSLSFVYGRRYIVAIILRILLGIGEAGFYAGMIYYLSFWYNRRELAFRISLCTTGTIPGWLGGFMAYGLARLHSPVLSGWQFLYLIEAIPSLVMAIVVLLWLPPFPFAAPFLTKRQRAIAVARLRDHRPKSHGGTSGWQAFKLVVKDPHSWGFALLYSSFNVCIAAISYFLPTLIEQFGFTPIQAQVLTSGPYVSGMLFVWFQAWHSDKTQDRGFHVMGSSFVAFSGYVILAIYEQKNHRVSYVATYLVVAGTYSFFPLVMSWAANTMAPTPKRGVGTAFMVSLSNVATIAAPQVYFDPGDSFRRAHAMFAGFMLLTFSSAFILRTQFAYLNKKRDRVLAILPREERQKLEGTPRLEDIADSDLRFRYMT